MNLFEIVMIGVGLSCDAAAVSVSNGLAFPKMDKKFYLLMPLFFGFFQGLMPLLGYFAGGLFADIIETYAGIVTFIILGIIGGKMIWDVFKGEDDEVEASQYSLKLLFGQAMATSIDAFAVGVSFAAERSNIFVSAPIIAVTTFICSVLALVFGKKLGESLGTKAQIFGGTVLILIGLKALF